MGWGALAALYRSSAQIQTQHGMSSVSNGWLYPSNGHRQLALLRILQQDAFNLQVWEPRGAACAFGLASPNFSGAECGFSCLRIVDRPRLQEVESWPMPWFDQPTRSCRSASWTTKLGAMARLLQMLRSKWCLCWKTHAKLPQLGANGMRTSMVEMCAFCPAKLWHKLVESPRIASYPEFGESSKICVWPENAAQSSWRRNM